MDYDFYHAPVENVQTAVAYLWEICPFQWGTLKNQRGLLKVFRIQIPRSQLNPSPLYPWLHLHVPSMHRAWTSHSMHLSAAIKRSNLSSKVYKDSVLTEKKYQIAFKIAKFCGAEYIYGVIFWNGKDRRSASTYLGSVSCLAIIDALVIIGPKLFSVY